MVKETSTIKERVVNAIFDAIDEVNELLPKDGPIAKNLRVELLGESSELDSLSVVNFIVSSEQKIEEQFGVVISLTDENAIYTEHSPFNSIGSLVDFVEILVEGHQNS